MGKDKHRHKDGKKKKKIKDECCEKHTRKGKYCKNCPTVAKCEVPGAESD